MWWYVPSLPEVRKRHQLDAKHLLVTLPSLLCVCQASERPCLKIKAANIRETIPEVVIRPPHGHALTWMSMTCPYTHTQPSHPSGQYIFHKALWNSFGAPSLLLWLCVPCLDPLPIPSPRPVLCHQGGVSKSGIRRSYLWQNCQGLVHDVSLSMGRPRQTQNTLEYQGKAPKWGEIREGALVSE